MTNLPVRIADTVPHVGDLVTDQWTPGLAASVESSDVVTCDSGVYTTCVVRWPGNDWTAVKDAAQLRIVRLAACA